MTDLNIQATVAMTVDIKSLARGLMENPKMLTTLLHAMAADKASYRTHQAYEKMGEILAEAPHGDARDVLMTIVDHMRHYERHARRDPDERLKEGRVRVMPPVQDADEDGA